MTVEQRTSIEKSNSVLERGLRYLGRCAVLTAALMTAAAPNYSCTKHPPPRKQESAVVVAHPKEGIAVGQEFAFGPKHRWTYGIKITGLTNNTATVDLTIPFHMAEFSSFETMSLRFNGIEISKSQVEPLAALFSRMANEDKDLAETMIQKYNDNDIYYTEREVNRARKKGKRIASGNFHWELHSLGYSRFEKTDYIMGDITGDFRNYVGPAVSISAGKGFLHPKVNIIITEKDENEFRLKIKGGPYDGRTIRLDRRMSISRSHMWGKSENFFTIPYRIEGLLVSKNGKVKAIAEIDCSRNWYLKGLTSELKIDTSSQCE